MLALGWQRPAWALGHAAILQGQPGAAKHRHGAPPKRAAAWLVVAIHLPDRMHCFCFGLKYKERGRRGKSSLLVVCWSPAGHLKELPRMLVPLWDACFSADAAEQILLKTVCNSNFDLLYLSAHDLASSWLYGHGKA